MDNTWKPQSSVLAKCSNEKDAAPLDLAKEISTVLTSADTPRISSLLLDIFGCIAFGRVAMKSVLDVLVAEIALFQTPSQQQISADTLWFWGTQLQPEGDEKSDAWKRLASLVKEVSTKQIVPADVLKTTLELNLLTASGICRDEAGIQKRLVKINTSLVYRQQKYNLLREETEGYSKLLTTLQDMPHPPQDPNNTIHSVLSVIGYFDLDPNRVMDITLEVYEHNVINTNYLTLLTHFRKSHIAHILGFKFTHYTLASAAPPSLYLLAASLISADLVALNDLLPYLTPSLIDANAQAKAADIASKLAINSYGIVDLSKSSSHSDKSKDDTGSSSETVLVPQYADGNQYVGLLAAALKLRNMKLVAEIHSLLRHGAPAVNPFDTAAARDALTELISWRIAPLTVQPLQLGPPLALSLQVKEQLLVPRLPPPATQCSQICILNELIPEIFPMVDMLNHHLSAAPVLFSQICALLKQLLLSIQTEKHEAVADETIEAILSGVLLPALSRVECNAFLANAVWGVLSALPYQSRFQIYAQWKGDGLGKNAASTKHSLVTLAEVKTLHAAKANLKRLSKENTKLIGRQLAKHTHSCSLIVFEFILNQVEVYDNLIPFVVEALKYTTELARDIMAFCLLNQLQKDSEKLRAGGTGYSGWFSALAKFTSFIYRRYPNTELKGLLHFLLKRLSAGASLDLLVLRELLLRMGGCETMLEVSHQQLEGLAGGRALQAEVMMAQKEGVNKKSIRILREVMISSGTALPLLLFIAQMRSRILYGLDTKQLKLISYLFDTCQDVLMQFTDFLVGGTRNSLDAIIPMMPSLRELLCDMGLAVPVAFQLVRPLIRAALESGEDPSAAPEVLRSWHPYSEEMQQVVREVLPAEAWEGLTPSLYMTFWSLSIYDIFLPKSRYEMEIRRLKDRYSELNNSKVAEDEKASKMRRMEMSRLLTATKTLMEESDAQNKHVDRMRKMILSAKDNYINRSSSSMQATLASIMQYCVLDRVTMSPVDATFCSQFFLHLHEIECPGFSTIHFFDRMMKTIAPLVFSTTEYEAGFIGFACNDLLHITYRWMHSAVAYNREAMPKVGFQGSDASATTKLDHDQFCRIYKSWHKKLRTIATSCMKSPEYMHIRSALVFLSKVAPSFPTLSTGGKVILLNLEEIEKKEKADREDLMLMAKSLHAIIKRRSPQWIDDEPPVVRKPAPKRDAKGDIKGEVVNRNARESSASRNGSRSKKSPSPSPTTHAAPAAEQGSLPTCAGDAKAAEKTSDTAPAAATERNQKDRKPVDASGATKRSELPSKAAAVSEKPQASNQRRNEPSVSNTSIDKPVPPPPPNNPSQPSGGRHKRARDEAPPAQKPGSSDTPSQQSTPAPEGAKDTKRQRSEPPSSQQFNNNASTIRQQYPPLPPNPPPHRNDSRGYNDGPPPDDRMRDRYPPQRGGPMHHQPMRNDYHNNPPPPSQQQPPAMRSGPPQGRGQGRRNNPRK